MSVESTQERRRRGYGRYSRETGVHALVNSSEAAAIHHRIEMSVPGDVTALSTRINHLSSIHPTPERQAELRVLRQQLATMKKIRREIR